ncbi:MAG: hypothetical protein NTV52_05335 [Acidobacteria bacterium]|nr:hypothetical protein [Acidobacteriota bacterium]
MRCLLFAFISLLTACAVPAPPSITEPPPRLTGGWTLKSAPPPTPPYLFNSNTEAFEAVQKWQKAPGEITFHDGNFLIVIPAKDIPKQASGDFVEAIMAAIH